MERATSFTSDIDSNDLGALAFYEYVVLRRLVRTVLDVETYAVDTAVPRILSEASIILRINSEIMTV